jgi:hypothetical protein
MLFLFFKQQEHWCIEAESIFCHEYIHMSWIMWEVSVEITLYFELHNIYKFVAVYMDRFFQNFFFV